MVTDHQAHDAQGIMHHASCAMDHGRSQRRLYDYMSQIMSHPFCYVAAGRRDTKDAYRATRVVDITSSWICARSKYKVLVISIGLGVICHPIMPSTWGSRQSMLDYEL